MALEVKNLFVNAEGKEILKGVNLKVEAGEVVALMGPNGSGKSSLAQTLMGNPKYESRKFEGCVPSSFLDGESLLEKRPDERARMGLFLAFQYPMAIEGVSVREILLMALRGRGEKKSALEIRQELEREALKMGIDKGLLERGLNEGFSGGEKKKMEMLQMRLLKPKYIVMDETDSGLDIDAIKQVALEAKNEAKRGAGVLVITHYKRIFKYLKPSRILVMKNGKIVVEGKRELIERLEEKGYQGL